MLKPDLIAAIAHGINAAYCNSLGDDSQPTWDAAPDWQKQSAIAGVNMHLANPNATPEQSHESWMQQKLAEGWQYGEEKNEEAKTHPCILPYAELPQEQQSKDYLFRATVHLVNSIAGGVVGALEEQVAALQAEILNAQQAANPVANGVAIKYIGVRYDWEDTLYSTGLYFTEGQVRIVPKRVAKLLLNHSDLFEAVEIPEAKADAASVQETSATSDDDTQELLDKAEAKTEEEAKDEDNYYGIIGEIQKMNKAAIVEYAEKNYSVKLDARSRVDDLRLELTKLVDQYGAM